MAWAMWPGRGLNATEGRKVTCKTAMDMRCGGCRWRLRLLLIGSKPLHRRTNGQMKGAALSVLCFRMDWKGCSDLVV